MNDPLSQFLKHSNVCGSIFSRAELGAPWAISTRGSVPTEPLGRGPAIFHVVLRGAGFIRVGPETDGAVRHTAWRSGDVLLISQGSPHVMCSDEGIEPAPIACLDAPVGDDGLPCITYGGPGSKTSILCGTFHFTAEAAELLRPQLPELLHLRCAEGPAAAWLDSTLRLLGAESASGLPGSEAVIARLADVLFVHAVRTWISEAPTGTTGWLSALGDPQLTKVINVIHETPAKAWTAATLAREAGMSRSALYTRFNESVGEAPAAYLTRWRMHVARRSLRSGSSLSETAAEVGYSSEAAFSRAFKRATGHSPSAWRRSA